MPRLLVCLFDELPRSLRVGVELRSGPPEIHCESGEALLGAVVEIALDAPSLGNSCVDGVRSLPRQLLDPL
jgi:hypothetical protein